MIIKSNFPKYLKFKRKRTWKEKFFGIFCKKYRHINMIEQNAKEYFTAMYKKAPSNYDKIFDAKDKG